eukprot:4814704-Prorocentrum_lima.AAC.1
MTSSLVGSEMCIRDSESPDTRISDLVVVFLHQCPKVRKRRNPAMPSPVSYTHLTLPTICSV